MKHAFLVGALLSALALPAAAHGPKWKKHYKRHGPQPVYYAAPPVAWVPAYGVIPAYYRLQIRPLPPGLARRYGRPPRGTRWGYYNGHAIAYRPQNHMVVRFGRLW